MRFEAAIAKLSILASAVALAAWRFSSIRGASRSPIAECWSQRGKITRVSLAEADISSSSLSPMAVSRRTASERRSFETCFVGAFGRFLNVVLGCRTEFARFFVIAAPLYRGFLIYTGFCRNEMLMTRLRVKVSGCPFRKTIGFCAAPSGNSGPEHMASVGQCRLLLDPAAGDGVVPQHERWVIKLRDRAGLD